MSVGDRAEVKELYRGPPEGFIGARDALVKRLRDEGRDDDAAEVKKLRRPTVAAWALDRLAVDASNTIGELLDAGAELARAQRATLSGRDPQALRDATTTRRELVARLTEMAVEVLRDAGRSPDAHVEDIRGTLEAASVDEAVAERLRAGTLDRTVQPSAGFGDMAGLQLVSRSDDEPEEAVTAGSPPLPGREARLRRIVRVSWMPTSAGSVANATRPSGRPLPPRRLARASRSRWLRCRRGSTPRARSSGSPSRPRPSSG